MSRCKSCDHKLSEFELKRKIIYRDGRTEYADMCTQCLKVSDTSMFKIKDSKNIVEDTNDYE